MERGSSLIMIVQTDERPAEKKNIKTFVIVPKIINDDGSSETYYNPETASEALEEPGHMRWMKSSNKPDGWNIVQRGQRKRSRAGGRMIPSYNMLVKKTLDEYLK